MNLRILFVAAVATLMALPLRAQTADTIYIATYLDVRPESTRAGAALIAQYAHATRAEAGNLGVDALQEIGRANRFVLIESWRDLAALTDHKKVAHVAAFIEKLRAIHRSPYDQRVTHGFAVDPLPKTADPKALYVVTHVDVPGARREEAEALLKRLFEASRTEPGRLHYDIYQQQEPRTNHFTTFTVWNNLRAFDTYGSTPHWLQFQEALTPMLGALYDERLYQRMRQ